MNSYLFEILSVNQNITNNYINDLSHTFIKNTHTFVIQLQVYHIVLNKERDNQLYRIIYYLENTQFWINFFLDVDRIMLI